MSTILKKLKNYSEKEKKLEWSGTLEDYIAIIKKNKGLHMNAHKRVLSMIESKGIVEEEDGSVSYNFFDKDIYGIEDSIEGIMEYLRAAASGSEVSRRILLMFGPTSSGKSQLAVLFKRGMEEFSKTKDGALYALEESPMHEDPLCAIPEDLRDDLSKYLGVQIKGDLSPYMAMILKEKYGGDFMKLPVKRIFVSEKNRVSIGTFVPSDKKSQDISELVGSLDISKIGTYGVESDPRAFRFDGELNIANRGMMEFVEMLKVDQKFLYVLLTLAQEKNIKTGRFPLIYADEFVLAHTNETEYRKFLANKDMEALHDRIIVVKVPYNLKVSDEVKIYEKLISQCSLRDIHISPYSLYCAAMFSVLSRLKVPKNKGLSVLNKMRLYDGEDVDGFSKADVKKIKSEFDDEGMEGISPRYTINRISSILAARDIKCITPIDVIRSIKEGLSSNPKLDSKEIDRLESILTMVIGEYSKIAQNEVQKAFFVNFEDEIQGLIKNYLDNVEAYLDNTWVEDEWGDSHEPNERLMRSIEEKINITESGKRSFRQEIYRKMLKSYRDNDSSYSYKDHPKLREALEKQLFEERKDIIRITVSKRSPDEESLKRINVVVETLCDKYGYTEESANQLLKYASSIMARS